MKIEEKSGRKRMVTLTEKLKDQVSTDLMSQLSKSDLVHILLDMGEPQEVLKTILTTRAGQVEMEQNASKHTGHRRYTCCYDCEGIHKVLKEVLLKHHLTERDILYS